MTPFDFLNAINQTKVDLFADPLAHKDYIPFMVNRGLSYFSDTIFYANEMNKHHEIDKDWQFYFLLNTVKKRKRFSKWAKKSVTSDNISLISEFYNCSLRKAEDFEKLLSPDQIQTIKDKLNKGGTTQ